MRRFPLLLLTYALTLTACDEAADLLSTTDEPEATYSETVLQATFFKPGRSATPSVSWNGDQGTISLADEPRGVTVNATTGRISWDQTLPPGTHDFDVIVANGKGNVVIPITIENPLQGTFTGTFDNAHYFSFDLHTDGTIDLRAEDPSDPVKGSGTWKFDNGKVRAVYVYEGGSTQPAFQATLAQSGTAATLTGDWYYDDSFTSRELGGTIEAELE